MINKSGDYYNVTYTKDKLIKKGKKLLNYNEALKRRENRIMDTDCVLNYIGEKKENNIKEGKGK